MSTGNRSGHGREAGEISPVLRPLAWSALLTAAVATALATPAFGTPAYAEPSTPDTIPDAGARPAPTGPLQLPGVGPATVQPPAPAPAPLNGPLAAAAYAKEVEVNALGDQLLKLREERTAATDKEAAAEARVQTAQDAVAEAQVAAEAMAATALKDAAALPPGTYGSALHGLSDPSLIGRGEGGLDVSAAERDLARAKAEEAAADEDLRAAQAARAEVDSRFSQLQATFRNAEASLLKLRRDNAAQLQLIDRAQEAFEQRLGANFVGRGTRSGMTAHPSAQAAVQYALAQLGDPYLWGAEGPDRFDCSGLMWAAYRSVGFQLPRVSRDQFRATQGRLVSRYDLLPGDLIFFASGAEWTSIHHVGMYLGDGRMVHAPRTGDVVKISTVWWSRFYAASRIFGEVPAPGLPGITSRPPIVVPPVPGVPTPPHTGTPTPPPTSLPTPGPTSPTPGPTSPTPAPTSPTPAPTSPTPEPTSPTPEPTSPTPTPDPAGDPTPTPTGSSGSSDASPEPDPTGSPSAGTSSEAASTEPTTTQSTPASPSASTGGS